MAILAGNTVRISVAFVDASGAPVDAAGVTMTYRHDADAPITVLEAGIVKDGMGLFHLDLASVLAGSYYVQASCASPAACVVETAFAVKHSII